MVIILIITIIIFIIIMIVIIIIIHNNNGNNNNIYHNNNNNNNNNNNKIVIIIIIIIIIYVSAYLTSPLRGGNQYNAVRVEGDDILPSPCCAVSFHWRENREGASHTLPSVTLYHLSPPAAKTVASFWLPPPQGTS